MKKYILLLFCFIPFISFSQLTENFSDGNFTANPAWVGDGGNFIVNASQQLQLNATVAGTSYLAIPASLATLDNMEWQAYVRLNFSPSSSNFGRIYLASDQSNLTGSLNGYYIQLGEALSNDAIELFKQTGTTSVSVARGTNAFIASSFTIRIKVTRSNAGLWSVYADPAAGSSFQLQATGTDATFNVSSFAGVVCTYTSGNIANYYFDDFFLGPIVADITPPAVSSIAVISQNQIDVSFTEAVEQVTAETESNYSVNNGINSPSSAIRDVANNSLVHLTFATNFTDGVTNTLSVLNVKDISNNTITTASTGQFTFAVPAAAAQFDVVINEIFPDETPQIGLPTAEYIEIYNRSSKSFDLAGWEFTDGGTPQTLPSKILNPGDFLIVCDDGDVAAFTPFGDVLGLTSFPSLNNDGDALALYDNNGNVIDAVTYDLTFYHDAIKSDGGWSIERIDPDFTCFNLSNWKASVSTTGGTPGSSNSVDGVFSDTQPPTLLRALVTGTSSVKVFFDEAMDKAILSAVTTYSVNNGFGNPASVLPSADFSSATLFFSSTILPETIYTLTVASSITDCAGNAINGTNTVRFAIPDTAAVSDLIINEILFNPRTDGVDFVELYNRSNKIIDLASLQIANTDLSNDSLDEVKSISSEGFLVFPGDYVALSESPVILKQQYETTNPDGFVKVEDMPSFNDDMDAVVIINNNFKRIDQFNYTEDYQFPLLNDPEGVSLERISFNRSTKDSTNWHSAAETVGFATPGYENSQHTEVVDDGSEVSLEPEVFSPDNDGASDALNVRYHFDAPGYTANLKVFDSKGRLIIHLVKNQLLGIDGYFIWDGITDNNEKAKVGIYVAYLEVFKVDGTVKKFKKPFVLASKL